jgi:uncharacterized protein (DUF2141 family)
VGPQLGLVCGPDITAHCATVAPGGGRIVKCLQDNSQQLDERCRTAVAPSDYPGTNQGVSITVTVDALRSKAGTLIVTLADDPTKFPTGRRTIIAPIQSDTVVVTFRHLKPGTYAVSALHDENSNGQFDATLNLVGSEGFGRSNGAIGPPDFAAAAVKVSGDTRLKVSMTYL